MKVVSRIYTALIFLFLYAPIAVMVVFSFNKSRTRGNWTGFTTKWYVELIRDDNIMHSLWLTLLVALLSAILASVIGTMAAIGVYSMKKRARSLVMTVNNIPMVNPEIVTAVSLMLLFVFIYKATGILQRGFLTLLLAHITFNIPYVVLSVLPKLRQMNPSLYEAAQDLGCRPGSAFFRVVLPEILPGVVTGFLMAFTLSLDDFIISLFTGGTSQTLSVLIYAMTKKKVSPKINALSTLIFASVFLLLLIVNLRQMKGLRRKNKTIKD